MKKYKTILLLIFLSFYAIKTNSQNSQTLIGKWKGTDFWKNKTDLIFTEDKNVSLTVNGEVIGGENFVVNGIKAELKYEVDLTKNPIWIDLIAIEKETKIEKGRIKGILKYINENNLEILLDFNGSRYENFEKENEEQIMIMKKV
jgi:hypothetical protein